MSRQDELIRQASMKARRDLEHYITLQESRMAYPFENLSDSMTTEINSRSKEGKLPASALVPLIAFAGIKVKSLRGKVSTIIERGINNSVDYGLKSGILSMSALKLPAKYNIQIGTSFIGKDGIVRRYNVGKETFEQSKWLRLRSSTINLLSKRPSGLVLSDRIWDVGYQAQKAIRSKITTAIALGESPAKLSRDIRGFLIEPKRLYRRVGKDGKLVLSKAAAAYHPGRGVYRSSYKNAMRLARTEMASAYHEATIQYVKSKKWLDGAFWRVGSGNPCEVCSDLDGKFFNKNEIPAIPHPHCSCWLQFHIEGEAT